MNILPVSFNTNYSSKAYVAPSNGGSKNYKKFNPLIGVQACDVVTFTSVANSDVLKRLLFYRIPCMYSGVIMLDPAWVQKILQRRIFTKPVRTIVKVLKPYEKSLFPVEKEVFSILKNTARRNPNARLDEIIHSLVPKHNENLLSIQKPIFDRLSVLSLSMPKELQYEYNALIEITNRKLSNKPVVVPFSLKEFKYKLGRIHERFQKNKDSKDCDIIRRMLRMANSVPEYSRAKRLSPSFPKKKYEKKINIMLTSISDYLDNSDLRNDKDLKDLINISRSRACRIPTNIKFNRKSFIYDLQKITNKLQDKKLAHKMVQTAISLPTSKDNLSAFIMKSAERSSEQIGFDLICGSIGSAEHLVPFAKGGEDSMYNYGLASAYMNSERAHRAFNLQLKMHPETYENCQKYVDRLIELSNNGVFKQIGLSKSYIISFVNKVRKLSPAENPLILDTSKLK